MRHWHLSLRILLLLCALFATTDRSPAPVTVLPEATPKPKEVAKPKPKQEAKPQADKRSPPPNVSVSPRADPFVGRWRSIQTSDGGQGRDTKTYTLTLRSDGGSMDVETALAFYNPLSPGNPGGNSWTAPMPRVLQHTSIPFSVVIRSDATILKRGDSSITLRLDNRHLYGWTPRSVPRDDWRGYLRLKNMLVNETTPYSFHRSTDGSLTPDVQNGARMERLSRE